jgi:DNA-directed RNA polymerase specialized sigma24 family protein
VHALRRLEADRASADDAAVTGFVRLHQRGLLRFLRALGAGAAAEEIAQDAFRVGLARVADAEPAVAAAFLRQTGKHLWLRRQRDDRRRAARFAAAVEVLWQRDCARDDGDGLLAALDLCLQTLPPRARLAVERVYRDGCSRAELAIELQIGEHGARTLLQRVRKGLRDCMARRLQR